MSTSDKKTRKSLTKKPLSATIGAAFLATAVAPIVSAEANPFVANSLDVGYDLANYGRKNSDGSCGEGTCGGKSKPTDGSCGEGTCGGSTKSSAEGKCGEGKCAPGKAAEGGCGSEMDDKAGRTNTSRKGRKKLGEGTCGEGMCGAAGQPQ